MKITKNKLLKIIDHLKDISFESGEILLKYQKRRHELRINDKGTEGIATQADSESEHFITSALKELYPEVDFLAEESCIDMKSALKTVKKSELCWVIDPLDGTNNYVNGIPIYAISIALVKNSIPIAGIVYNPLSGECFYAADSLGASYVDFRVNPLKEYKLTEKKNNKSPEECIFSPSPSYEKKDRFQNQLDTFKKNIVGARAVRRLGSAALELCYVANGNFDAYWEQGLKPWDTAAAWIVCKEAQVKVTDFFGQEHTPFSESIIAARENLHSTILGKINR